MTDVAIKRAGGKKPIARPMGLEPEAVVSCLTQLLNYLALSFIEFNPWPKGQEQSKPGLSATG